MKAFLNSRFIALCKQLRDKRSLSMIGLLTLIVCIVHTLYITDITTSMPNTPTINSVAQADADNRTQIIQARPVRNNVTSLWPLVVSPVSELRAVAAQQQVFAGRMPDVIMTFTTLPNGSVTNAVLQGQADARTITEIQRYATVDLILEPPVLNTTAAATMFTGYAQGAFDEPLAAYFQSLANNGVHADKLVVTSLGETNVPVFGVVPSDTIRAQAIARTIHAHKRYLPGSKANVLFDAQTCPAGDSQWAGCSYDIAYDSAAHAIALATTQMQLKVDGFTLQGFPWLLGPMNDTQTPSTAVTLYLNAAKAIKAAQIIDAPAITFHTGTYRKLVSPDDGKTYTMQPTMRSTVLAASLAQAAIARQAGFATTLSIFAENKWHTAERADWSYNPLRTADSQIITNIANAAHSADIQLEWFDLR
jgi:hypothetical protein